MRRPVRERLRGDCPKINQKCRVDKWDFETTNLRTRNNGNVLLSS